MEYTVLDETQRTEILHGHLLQAEADHFIAGLNAAKARAAAKATADDEERRRHEQAALMFERQQERANSDRETLTPMLPNNPSDEPSSEPPDRARPER